MKATDLLEKQHRSVEKLFAKLEKDPEDKLALLEQLANELAAHMAIEQDVFYPAVYAIDDELIDEGFEEHALAELALKRLLSADPEQNSHTFKARVTALKELIEHHVKEEEKELFPKVEKKLEADQLQALGKQMQADFEEHVAVGYASVVPRGFAKTSADVSAFKKAETKAETKAERGSNSRAPM